MQIVQQLLFVFLSAVAVFFFSKKVKEISRNIKLGRDETLSDNSSERWKNLLLLAFGQKKMFRNPLVAVMHFFVYAGFIIINIEVLEIVLDGITGKHRLFAAPLGSFYSFLINSFEVLALLVLVACIIFLVRRNIIKLKRFISKDLDGWPRSDANYILITEIVLMSLFLLLNASDTLLQIRGVEHYARFQPEQGKFDAWMALREKRLAKPGEINVAVENVKVHSISATAAEASFTQNYRSADFKDSIPKTLHYVENGQWKIVRESNR